MSDAVFDDNLAGSPDGAYGEPEADQTLTDPGAPEMYDTDFDGVSDLFVKTMTDGSLVAVYDENGDLKADTLGVDFNGDGVYEVVVVKEGDGYRAFVDRDGDGVHEVEQLFTRDELLQIDPQVVQGLELQFGVGSGVGNPFPAQGDEAQGDDVVPDGPLVTDGQLVGDPAGDSEHWFEQAANGFCVPASVAQIVSEYTGEHFADEQYFVERANELKVFEVGPDGVPGVGADGALALLEDAGIPASIEFGTGVDTLVDYLEDGRRVVLAIDSGEIWYGEDTEDQAADHAIVVTGVDLERGVVIVSDPGDPDGNGKEYPIDVFEDAWADSGYAAIVCDVTPEEFQREAGEGGVAGVEGQAQGGIEDLGLGKVDSSPTETAVDWAVQHAWAILPILLGARLVAGSINRNK